MTRWSDVRLELDALLALDDAAREARLTALEARAPELAAEVRSLLEHDRAAQRTRDFLERTGAPEDVLSTDRPPPAEPRRIGPYELLRELGSGGMGVVHLARRADGAFERRVAIKVIQGAWADAQLIARFRRERQVLANLEHPGIARLIEGGTEPGGARGDSPYLVMEYVEGTPIDEYCDTERLPVRARIELFIEVCGAVQHAHNHLVVHRDLKPSNILITARGEPKLLDFGIAKVLDPEKTSAGPEMTVGLARFMTPAYASPEQVAGRLITTSSDVYGLGVVLYRLLTGQLPYPVDTSSAAELERIVCEQAPSRPSTASRQVTGDEARRHAGARLTTARALSRSLAGDLDRIVLKALRKEPRMRYASAEALAEDLRRHLAGLPVSARADTFLYRSSRFVRRNRTGVAAALFVLSALVAGLIVSWRQYQNAEVAWTAERDQRQQAEVHLGESRRLAEALALERTTAEERAAELQLRTEELEASRALAEARFDDVQDFATELIFDVHDALAPIEGTIQARELVVASGLQYLDRLKEQAADDPLLLYRLAGAYLRIAGIQGSFGLPNLGHAREALASADKSLELAEALATSRPESRVYAALLSRAYLVRSSLWMADGQEERTISDLRTAIELSARLDDDPEVKATELYVVSASKGRLAEVLLQRGAYPEAGRLLREAEGTLLRVIALGGSLENRAELPALRATLAQAEYQLGDADEAARLFDLALEGISDLVASQPASRNLQRSLLLVRSWYSNFLLNQGDLEGAALLLEENRAIALAEVAGDPSDFQGPLDRMENTAYLMRVRFMQEDWPEMLRLGEEELPYALAHLARDPESVQTLNSVAALRRDIGSAQLRMGLHLEAVENLSRAREILEDLVARDDNLVGSRRYLGRVYAELGRAYRAAAATVLEDPVALERHVANSAEWFGAAVEVLEALQGLGVDPRELNLPWVREELRVAREALASLRDPGP